MPSPCARPLSLPPFRVSATPLAPRGCGEDIINCCLRDLRDLSLPFLPFPSFELRGTVPNAKVKRKEKSEPWIQGTEIRGGGIFGRMRPRVAIKFSTQDRNEERRTRRNASVKVNRGVLLFARLLCLRKLRIRATIIVARLRGPPSLLPPRGGRRRRRGIGGEGGLGDGGWRM